MTEDESNAALAAMTVQREQELAGVEAHYRLRKACTARAVELYEAATKAHAALGSGLSLDWATLEDTMDLGQLLNEIKDDAK